MNKRHGNLRAAAAVVVLAALGFSAPSAGTQKSTDDTARETGSSPVARGMLIPARMRLMVRFFPSRTA